MYTEEDVEIDVYCNEYREIFSKLIYIFTDSDFPFNREQHQLIRQVCQATRSFGGDPLASDLEEVKIQFMALIASIGRNHPQREIVRTHTCTRVDINGPVIRIVRYISYGMTILDRLATDHFKSFRTESTNPQTLIANMIEQFLRYFHPLYVQLGATVTTPTPMAHPASSEEERIKSSSRL